MIEYNLVDHPWFSQMFEMRELWIPAYFRDIFMGGIMRVTSRSESENSFFDRFVTPHVSLVEFWMCYESAMEAQRHKQHKLNYENKQSQPHLQTPVLIEKHAAEIYTHNVFKDVQKEICAAVYTCTMDDLNKNDGIDVYTISDSEKEGRTWTVTYSQDKGEVTCSCSLFDRIGTLCRHIFWVLKTKRMNRIPEQYIVSRWTKDAMKKPMFNKQGQKLGEAEIYNDKRTITTELWEEVYSAVSVAEDNIDDMQELVDLLKGFKLGITKSNSVLGNSESGRLEKQKEMERYVGCRIPDEINIQAPKKSHNKGSGKRIESEVINALTRSAKKARYCKRCGGEGHDSRNCTKNP